MENILIKRKEKIENMKKFQLSTKNLQNLIMKLLIDFDHKNIIILKIFFRIYFHLPSTFLLLEQIPGVLMICSFEIS